LLKTERQFAATTGTIGYKIERLISDSQKLNSMRENAFRFGKPNAAFEIADQLSVNTN
jgi:UDP-N-acetylglucosamine:LPS N-acetylglucosamine transferase